ncbi:MAG: hypothetical protein WD342_11210 [Verrucomicrobiales bacterium]
MRTLFPSIALTLLIASTSAEAQVRKSGGLFGFGRKEEQLSAGLFPESSPGTAPAQAAERAERTERDNDTIFRGGKPRDIEAVSYVIRDGQKVEREVPEKRNFFAFGRKDRDVDTIDRTMATPAPEPQADAETSGPVAAPVATPIPEPRAMDDSPNEKAKDDKKAGGFFSFLPWNKEKEEAEDDAPRPVAAPVAEPDQSEPPSAPEVAESKPAPAGAPSVPEFSGVEVPRKDKKEKKEKKEESDEGGGLLAPLANLKPARKPTEYENAETIIADGEIVESVKVIEEEESAAQSNAASDGEAPSEPPKTVDGVKTYSSWGDVDARSSSAADQILKKLR